MVVVVAFVQCHHAILPTRRLLEPDVFLTFLSGFALIPRDEQAVTRWAVTHSNRGRGTPRETATNVDDPPVKVEAVRTSDVDYIARRCEVRRAATRRLAFLLSWSRLFLARLFALNPYVVMTG